VDWSLVLPELIVAGAGIGVLLLDLFLAPEKRRLTGYASLAGLAAAMFAALWLAVAKVDWSLAAGAGVAGSSAAAGFTALGGMVAVDAFSALLKLLFLAIGLVVVLLGVDFAEKRKLPVGEFFALLLFAILGMMLMAGSRDLIMIYLGLETTAISSYALAGLLKDDLKSGEAALKYFLTGALASAIILFGMALVFGGTGSTNLVALLGAGATTGQPVGAGNPVALTGLVLLVAGFGFKLAAVPFHFWAPDAYEGAPTPVTAFFSVGPKAAAFAVVLRIFGPVLALGGSAGGAGGPASVGVLGVLFGVLAVVTMTIGNLTALAQKNVKRMLAYSSIAHAGYLLVGLAVASPRGFAAMVYYLLAYAAMNLGAFAVVIWLNNRGTGDEVSDYAGLGRRAPLAALAMVICLLSLIGIPPMAGFFGKFYLFAAAVEANMAWLAVVMVINSAISVGYYYGLVRQMYLAGDVAGAEDHGGAEGGAPAPTEATSTVQGTPLVGLALGLAVVAVFVLGFLFEPLARLARLAGGGL
jgi:NADH-quinone oxidoreductase subunit N